MVLALENRSSFVCDAELEISLRNKFPVHLSCRNGDLAMLTMLIESSHPSLCVDDCFYGWSAAHWAAYYGKLDCLQKLLSLLPQGSSVDIMSELSQSLTHLAAFGGHVQCLHWLFEHGANPNVQDYLGESPLHKAARSGSRECVQLLISYGANVQLLNKDFQTASQLASACGHSSLAEMLKFAESERRLDIGYQGITLNGHTINSNVSPNFANGEEVKSRKRSNGYEDEQQYQKRIRINEPAIQPPIVHPVMAFNELQESSLPATPSRVMSRGGIDGSPYSGSFYEHQDLHSVERSYNSCLLDQIISEVHGC